MDKFQESLAGLFKSLSAAEVSALNSSLATIAKQQAQMSVGNGPATLASKSASKNRRRLLGQHNKPKRPLNAFIAYRSYYSPLFKTIPQKVKSGLLRMTWAADTKRPMWALLGSAYSDLRDHHDESLALDKFLSLTVPLLPIVPADEYLNKTGWELSADANNAEEPVLVRSPAFNAALLAAEYPQHTSRSVADIVSHCYTQGLLPRSTRKDLGQNRRHMFHNHGHHAGTDAGNHTPPPPCGSLTLAVTPLSSATVDTEASSIEATPEVSGDEDVDADAGISNNNVNDEAEVPIHDAIMSSNTYLTIAAITADQQAAFEDNDLALHFHPRIQPPILGFDPRIIQDDFDPFDLDFSGLINFNA
ncbi:hypothetical protein RBB50_011802 [Rhinocladiella similis]